MLYITGDIHGENECRRLNNKNCFATKNDYVIICGDFGILWKNIPDDTEKYWINWLNSKPWTTLFIDGNHDNHLRLSKLSIVNKFNGKVGQISDKIFHLKRGEIYNIDNKSIFTFGGADSIDKKYRILNISYWNEEIPSLIEYDYALNNLNKVNNTVDYIITHTGPERLILSRSLMVDPFMKSKIKDPTCSMLENIYNQIYFREWWCGHFHTELKYDTYKGPINIIYQKIKQLK